MEKLCAKISNNIASELNLDNDKREIIAYGTFALLQMIVSIFVTIIFGYIFNVLIEALIVSFIISILRKYSGGIHASSPGICTLLGTIVCISEARIACILGPLISLKFNLVLGLITFSLSYYVVYKLAPVDSLAKPIKKEQKRKRMKKGSIIVLSAYGLIAIINAIIYLYSINVRFLIFSICIYEGILWQVFTLTYIGHVILGKIDTFLNHIFGLFQNYTP